MSCACGWKPDPGVCAGGAKCPWPDADSHCLCAHEPSVGPSLVRLSGSKSTAYRNAEAIQRVRELHDGEARGICPECSDDVAVGWPCATIQALDGAK